MLVVLRMNREFMQYMREHHNELTADHFKRTVVDERSRATMRLMLLMNE